VYFSKSMCDVCAQAVFSINREPAMIQSFLMQRIFYKLGAFGYKQKPVV
jgi:hypothetical protein